MTTSDVGKVFLQVCLAKRLLDKAQAKEIWERKQQTGESPQRILVERGLMAQHTVQALEKEMRRAQEPRAVGGFQLIKPLGQGGMATVFLARQISLGREVALKLMAPQIATNPEAAERFLREARVAATVNHPNVISIIDVGQTDGQLYMALELVSGGDAAQLAARFGGTLQEARALELLIDCAKGLQALYEARLVHRDLKPSNIFITSDGAAKLGDLGLARNEDGADRMTVTGHLVGTPAFMSPEQAGGDGAVDIRSDIYALGATLFALVTGRQPFVANSPIAVAAKALTEPAPDPRSLAPHLSAMTATLILQAMAKSAAERFQTPRELREALEQALAQAPQATQRAAARTSATTKSAEAPTPVTIPSGRRAPSRATRQRATQGSWMVLAAAMVVLAISAALVFQQKPAPAPITVPTSTKPVATTVEQPAKPTPTPTTAATTKPVNETTPILSVTVPPIKPEAVPAKEPLNATTGDVTVTTGVEASPPLGEEPPRVPWATAQGKDAFGHWIIITINGAQQRLRWLPPGTCVVGSPPNEPGHMPELERQSTVTFSYGSWMADTECTQTLWQSVTGKNPSLQKGERLPVNMITVAEAITFTHSLRPHLHGALVRLPSRAEWERACRAGTSTIYATGNTIASLAGYANMFDQDARTIIVNHPHPPLPFSDGFAELAPVASLRPNRWGFYDMHGNVNEFCLAIWGLLPPTCRDPMTDDLPDAQVGYIRGGAYNSAGNLNCRVASMPFIGKTGANPDIGFRFLIESR
jgi:serine/threonine protein kinase/formylglycine-generating enzyme required for sulfatase activity